MSIPPFTVHGTLPPYTGRTPADGLHMAPYVVTLVDVVDRFATSPERIRLVRGLIAYRRRLTAVGLVEGFQWIDGSFVEVDAGRPPRDIDLVTFFERPPRLRAPAALEALFHAHPEAFDPTRVKAECGVDAYLVDLSMPQPAEIVHRTRYWFGLFSHRRGTGQWKGMLQIPLGTMDADAEAEARVESEPTP